MKSKRLQGITTTLCSLALIALCLNPSPALAATSPYVEGSDIAAPLFDPTTVSRVDLIVPQSSITKINEEYPVEYNAMWSRATNFTYVPAQIRVTTPTGTYGPLDVEIHLKGGWGSLRSLNEKAGFKVKINSTGHKDQRLLGLKKLTFNNNVQDGSYTHEAIAYRLFRNVGVPAPRVGYARIYMNCAQDLNPEQNSTCVDYGLHTNIETMDEVALARWVKGTTHLYEGGTPYFPDVTEGSVFQTDLGSPSNNSEFQDLIRINQLDGSAWFDAMSKRADMKEMTLEWATEAFVGHWDGYANNKNNFYLHSDSKGIFQVYPWGTDQTWTWWTNDLFSFTASMPSKCMSYIPCRTLYSQSLVNVWATAKKLDLPRTTIDIYSGIWESDLGPHTDPFSSCNVDCGFSNAANIYNIVKAESNYVVPIARTMATVRPSIKVTNRAKISTLTWPATNVPGVTVNRYEIQKSTNGITWTALQSSGATMISIKNLKAGTVRYYRVRVVTSLGTSPWSVAIRVRSI